MTTLYEWYRLYAAEITLGISALTLLLLVWVITLQWRLHQLQRRYQAAMRASDGSDLEQSLTQLHQSQQAHGERLRALEGYSRSLGETLANHAGHVGIVRFNPFQDSGGDQSFAIAWVDEGGNGIVLSSLHSRAGTRIYAKPLAKGQSSYNLTEEEQAAITSARP